MLFRPNIIPEGRTQQSVPRNSEKEIEFGEGWRVERQVGHRVC